MNQAWPSGSSAAPVRTDRCAVKPCSPWRFCFTQSTAASGLSRRLRQGGAGGVDLVKRNEKLVGDPLCDL